jgi:hypothetical protein
MAKSISDIRVRKKRGRKKPGPPRTTGPGEQVLVRLHQPMLGELERWAAKSGVTRAEAIRRLIEAALSDNNAEGARSMIERALAGSEPTKQTSPKAAAKASEMAGEQIDKIGDPSATAEERQQRKRRLIKGPREFRDMRGDRPKPKG